MKWFSHKKAKHEQIFCVYGTRKGYFNLWVKITSIMALIFPLQNQLSAQY